MKQAIVVEDLTKRYGNRRVLDRVSFSVEPGECFCLLGPNGAGKTTTVKIITGFLTADAGNVTVLDTDVLSHASVLKGRVSIIPQHPALDPFLTVRENLIFWAMLQKFPTRKIREKVDDLLRLFALEKVKDQVTYHTSGGEVRRLLIACAFLKPGEILFMDEPTSGIDILFKNQLWDMFKEQQAVGVTVFLNTHDLNEAEVLSNRIAFIFNGRIVTIDSPERLKKMTEGIKVRIKFRNRVNTDCQLVAKTLKDYEVTRTGEFSVEFRVPEMNGKLMDLVNSLNKQNSIVTFEVQQPSLNDVFRKLGIENAGDNLA